MDASLQKEHFCCRKTRNFIILIDNYFLEGTAGRTRDVEASPINLSNILKYNNNINNIFF